MKRLFFSVLVIFISVASVYSKGIESLNFRKSFLIIYNNYDFNDDGIPETPDEYKYYYSSGFNVGLTIGFLDWLAIEPELTFFDTFYGYFEGNDRWVLVESSERELYIYQIGVEPNVLFRFRLFPFLRILLNVSPSFIFPFPINAWDGNESRYGEWASDFYGRGQFFQPSAGVALLFDITDKILLEIKGKTYFPIFHAWDDKELQFIDQFKINLSFGFQFQF